MVETLRLGEVTERVDSLGRPRRMPYVRLPEQADPSWRRSAACLDRAINPSWFHSNDPDDISAAIRICRTCPVVKECAKEQRLLEAPGVWGGKRFYPANRGVKRDTRW